MSQHAPIKDLKDLQTALKNAPVPTHPPVKKPTKSLAKVKAKVKGGFKLGEIPVIAATHDVVAKSLSSDLNKKQSNTVPVLTFDTWLATKDRSVLYFANEEDFKNAVDLHYRHSLTACYATIRDHVAYETWLLERAYALGPRSVRDWFYARRRSYAGTPANSSKPKGN